jgi:hypothetical protein
MDAKDIMEIDENQMRFLITMKDWFIAVEDSDGPFIYWSSTTFGAGDVYTTTIIKYIDMIIDTGWYDRGNSKDILNWMRELYIVNHKRPHIHTSLITTI